MPSCRGRFDDLARALLDKAPRAHKFDHGHVLVIAGGPGQGGAARLAARAALRVGAGLVTIAPPSTAMGEHAAAPDALMRRPVDGPQDLVGLLRDPRISTVLIGPGCGIERALSLLPAVLQAGRKTVFDADALTALSRHGGFQGLTQDHVLTPHLGEFARLFPDLARLLTADGPDTLSRVDAARTASLRAGAVVLLKGADTVIGRGGLPVRIQASCYDAAAPWLGTAGSGDVLAGLIAGLLARGFAAGHGAAIGAALHAAAGRVLGPGLIADDLPEILPRIIKNVIQSTDYK
ncbi:NAD(P)H-hydrate dehydratase [Paracoccus sp. DMF-8]|uniref:NAD(P)H-hydrate dehydratase n=1 Tax=Paracoccus sp. DMF-8 TaxID=3019445 RepID=UPI0023E8DFD3|nr:NAD(P)H-hydrate dehydratase [Paracoccus sp. DMF-8]MDF3605572.1 NAD(P)H-hydrate dehydratase [Paracoccus sp. DMF-8]